MTGVSEEEQPTLKASAAQSPPAPVTRDQLLTLDTQTLDFAEQSSTGALAVHLLGHAARLVTAVPIL